MAHGRPPRFPEHLPISEDEQEVIEIVQKEYLRGQYPPENAGQTRLAQNTGCISSRTAGATAPQAGPQGRAGNEKSAAPPVAGKSSKTRF